ncbi:maleylpyruvate isomerase family mycothiol-dependent enzyme [Nocardia noduli]|uniref:maleylpyruvate isomerase family mycothiol-dependent enzyme n=1 Tax=Nocardia noduli TaxID=2815722 RepID=UPI001C22415D|nr:maleylpyruvate isomerase family mycothiol-dependent enzyme [Nocardia noduli]
MSPERPSADQIWNAVATERASLVELLEALPPTAWDHASLCAGWRVRDVVAHVVLSAHAEITTILIALIRARGSLDALIRDSAVRHADERTNEQLVTELRDTIAVRFTPVGTIPADRLMDLLVHGQDIAVPLGLRREMPITAAHLAATRVWAMGTRFRARKKFGGYRLIATDTDWAVGAGLRIEGPVADLLLLITGRYNALNQLTGEGVAQLLSRRDRSRR